VLLAACVGIDATPKTNIRIKPSRIFDISTSRPDKTKQNKNKLGETDHTTVKQQMHKL